MDFDGKAQGTGLRGKKKDGILKAAVKQLTHVYQSEDTQGQEPRLSGSCCISSWAPHLLPKHCRHLVNVCWMSDWGNKQTLNEKLTKW